MQIGEELVAFALEDDVFSVERTGDELAEGLGVRLQDRRTVDARETRDDDVEPILANVGLAQGFAAAL